MDMLVGVSTRYEIVCYGPDGRVKWRDVFTNLVVTAGLNKLLDATFKTGLASPAWYVLLKGAGTVDAGDTLASHTGWSELTDYTGDRPALTLGTISGGSVDNAASKASFACTGSATVAGAGICDAASGTSGTLYGAGDFTGGSKSVANGDTLEVTATLTATAS